MPAIKSFIPLILISFLFIPAAFATVDSDRAEIFIAEGEALLELGEKEEANLLFRKALSVDPQNREAKAYLEESLPLDEQDISSSGAPADASNEIVSEPLIESPAVFEEEEIIREEEREYISAEDADVPLRPRLRLHYFYRRGLEAYESSNYREAIGYFEEALKIDPAYRRADYYRRESWNNIAMNEFNKDASKKAGEEIPEEKIYDAFARGKEYMRSGEYEAAITEFQKVLTVTPGHDGARELLGEARLKLEQKAFEEQVSLAERIMEEEEAVRGLTEAQEEIEAREIYEEGRQLYREEELEAAREKFVRSGRQRDRYRRSGHFIRRIDEEIEERKEFGEIKEEEAIRKYTLGPEDAVKVVVRNHPEFSFSATVEEGGELIIPLTNEIINAKGLTRDELAEEIRKKLIEYIDNPFVNVFITEYASKKFYVLQPQGGGAEYVMDKANMTLWDCMFRAGIPQLGSSAMRRVQVITPHKTHPTHRWINVYAMLYQGKMEDNIRIEPGTIIYYPMLVIDKFDEIIQAITRPISSLASLGSSYDQWDDFRKEYLK